MPEFFELSDYQCGVDLTASCSRVATEVEATINKCTETIKAKGHASPAIWQALGCLMAVAVTVQETRGYIGLILNRIREEARQKKEQEKGLFPTIDPDHYGPAKPSQN